MFKFRTDYNAANLLEQLESKGFTINEGLNDFIINQQQEKELPLYLRALIGLGALIASYNIIFPIVFTSFLYAKPVIALIIWGLVFVAGAVGLERFAGHNNDVKHSFFIQSSFALMIVGKILFALSFAWVLKIGWFLIHSSEIGLSLNQILNIVWGFDYIYNQEWTFTIGLLIITAITYNIYRLSIDRFLSSLAVLYLILVNILGAKEFSGWRELLLNGFFLFQFTGAAILLTYGKIKRDYIPLSYAFAFSLCATVLFLASYAKFGYWNEHELINPAFINTVLSVGLIGLFGWVAGDIKKLKTLPLILASLGAVLLGVISAPGILLAIGLMVLGYAKYDKILVVAGGLLMPIFLWLYYYNMDIFLLQKSGILIGSGIALLAGRFYLTYKGWDKGDAACVQK